MNLSLSGINMAAIKYDGSLRRSGRWEEISAWTFKTVKIKENEADFLYQLSPEICCYFENLSAEWRAENIR